MVSPRKRPPVRKFDDRRIYRRLVSSGREERGGGDNGGGSLDRGGPRHSSSEAIEETVNGADKIRGTSLESNGQVSVGHFHFARLPGLFGYEITSSRPVRPPRPRFRSYVILLLPSVRSFDTSHTGRMACARVTCHSFQKGRKVNIISILRKAYIYIAILAVQQCWSLNRCFPREGSSKILIENVPRESCSKLITSYEARHEGEDRGSSPPI